MIFKIEIIYQIINNIKSYSIDFILFDLSSNLFIFKIKL